MRRAAAPGLDAFACDRDVKQLREGAHRAAALQETLRRARAVAPRIGLTRLGFLTGLDHVGAPVAMAVRPNARSAAISLGKGLTDDHAAASALMESIECWHAETIARPLVAAPSTRPPGRPLDLSRLPPLTETAWTSDLEFPWIEGVDLMSGESLWAPYEVVHAAYTAPMPPGSGCFFASTNGLASGNTPTESLVHAMTEVIERDATTLWIFADEAARESRRIDPASVADPACRSLIDRFDAAGLMTAIWETTSDVGVPAFFVWIMEREDGIGGAARSAIGQGCHLYPAIALSRALTEAAQHRLTVISGARDDLGAEEYEAPDPEIQALRRQLLAEGATPRRFVPAPAFASDHLGEDAAFIVERLAAVGVTEVFALDLSKPEIGVAVTRAVIPGLEGPHDHARYAPGARATAVIEAAAQVEQAAEGTRACA
ncbi:MAG: YcaO-like family protein [Rubrimonas sp.]|uniref:YcaO-like family protein n=1 Tax=Rubrimonas sp. TaxID=2036015 RepID=UPI002FDE5CB9